MPRALSSSSSYNAFTAGSPSRSIDKGTTTKSGPPSPAWSRSSEGISSRQGTHQVAQMLSSTNRPSNAFSVISSPSPSTNVSSGNGLGVSSTDRENSLPGGAVVTGVPGEDNTEISCGAFVT